MEKVAKPIAAEQAGVRNVSRALWHALRNPKLTPIASQIALIRREITYRGWKVFNRQKNFADFCAWQVIRKLDRGRAHRTLGERRIDQDSLFATPAPHDSASFAAGDTEEFAELVLHGLHARTQGRRVRLRIMADWPALHSPFRPQTLCWIRYYRAIFFRQQGDARSRPYRIKATPVLRNLRSMSERGCKLETGFRFRRCGYTARTAVRSGVLHRYALPPETAGRALSAFLRGKADREVRLKGKSWTYEASQLTSIVKRRLPDAQLKVIRCSFKRKPAKIRTWEAVIIVD
ncbi:MAG: hypothetical protein ACI915_002867 [Gammaproteobacteria bacterium]